MQTNSSFSIKCMYWRKNERDIKTSSNRLLPSKCSIAGLFLTLLLISSVFCRPANADYLSAAQPLKNIENQTFISVALTTPATSVHINVSEYDSHQMVKIITLDFTEPVTYVSFVIDILKEKPLIINAPNSVPIIQYYEIRYLTGLADKIANVTIILAIERAKLQNMTIVEDALIHYQYNGTKFNECPLRKIVHDKNFLFFETETSAATCFAITGATTPNLGWPFLVLIAVIILLAIIGVWLFRRFPKKSSTKLGEAIP